MIQVKFTNAVRTHFENEFKRYLKETEKSVEEALTQVAKIAAKNLISKVQPYGVSNKQGEKLQMNIAKQVHRAIKHGNVAGQQGGASELHEQNRDSRGRVPKNLETQGKYQRAPVSIDDRMQQAKRKMENAGIAKAGWLTAHNQIDGEAAKGIGKWITRHAGKNGYCRKTGAGLNHKITLVNDVPYIERIQSNKDVAKSISQAYSNFTKFMLKRMAKR
jgi:hypothetical protein